MSARTCDAREIGTLILASTPVHAHIIAAAVVGVLAGTFGRLALA